MNFLRSKLTGFIFLAFLIMLGAESAQATHFRGGFISASIDATGLVTVNAESLWRNAFVARVSTVQVLDVNRVVKGNITLTQVGVNDTSDPSFTRVIEQGAGSLATMDVGGAALPAGTYILYKKSNARISGLANVGQGSFSYESVVHFNGTANSAPTINSSVVTGVAKGFDYSQNLNAIDPDGGPLSYALITNSFAPDFGPTSQVPGMTVDSTGQVFIPAASTATLQSTNLSNPAGDYVFKVRITDASGSHTDRDVLLDVVTGTNINPPVLAAIGNRTVAVGSTLTFPVTATFIQTAGNPASGTFSFTPVAGDVGVQNVSFNARDDGVPNLVNSQLVSITVTGNNHPPVLNPVGNQSAQVGIPLTFTINGSDPDGNALTYNAAFLPAGVTFNPTTRVFSWTPTVQGITTGIVFQVTDNGVPNLSAQETISISVGAVNHAPVLTGVGDRGARPGVKLSFVVGSTDVDAGDVVTLSLGTGGLPPGATFNAVSGLFQWMPAANQLGLWTVNFKAIDNGTPSLSDIQTVRIGVGNYPDVLRGTDPNQSDTDSDGLNDNVETDTGVFVSAADTGTDPVRPDTDGDGFSDGNEVASGTAPLNAASQPVVPPVAVPDSGTTLEDTPLTTVNVLLNDTDANGDVLSVSAADAVSANGGTVTNNGNGTFLYSPVLNFNGTDTFMYTVSDGNGGTAIGTVTITVMPVNDPPTFTGTPVITPASAQVGTTLNLSATGTADVDGNVVTLSYQWKANGVNTATTAFYTISNADAGKSFTCVIVANDGSGAGNATVMATTAAVTDQTAPAMNAHSPLTAATGVMVNSPVVVTFSEPMNTATITTGTFMLSVTTGAAVTGTLSFNATGTVATFVPAGNLQPIMNYTVTLSAGVTDVAGNALAAAPVTFTFTTGANTVTLPSVLPVVQGPVTTLGNYDGFSMLWNGVANGANKANRWSGVFTTPTTTITGLATFLDGVAVVPAVAGGALPTKIGANRIIQLGALNSGDNLAASVSLDGQFIAATNLDLNLTTVEEMLFVKRRVPIHTAATVAGLYNMVEFVRTPGATVNTTSTSHGVLTVNAAGTWTYAGMGTTLINPATGAIGAPFPVNDNGTFVIDANGTAVTTSLINPNMTMQSLVSADGNYLVLFRMDTGTRESGVMIGVRQHATTVNVANLTTTTVRFAPSEAVPLFAMRGEVGMESTDANGLLNNTHGSVIDNAVVCGVGIPPVQPNCQFMVDPATTVTAGANGTFTLTDTTGATFSGFASQNGNVFLSEDPGRAISINIKQ